MAKGVISRVSAAVHSTLPWYALKVRTGSESLAVKGLSHRGYVPFAPTFQERRRYSDRIKLSTKAVFPGYVFCRFDTANKIPVLSSPAVENVVSFGGVYARVSDDEIERIRKAVLAGAVPTPYITIGQQVEVRRGTLTGVRGIVLRRSGRDTLVISMDLLRRSVALEIDADCLAPLTN